MNVVSTEPEDAYHKLDNNMILICGCKKINDSERRAWAKTLAPNLFLGLLTACTLHIQHSTFNIQHSQLKISRSSSPGATADAMSAAVNNVDGAASDSTNKDDNTVGMNQAQTTNTETEDEKTKRDAEQKVAVRQKRYHLIDTTRDIYGRVPGNEPTYPIPCPSELNNVERFERIDYFNFVLLVIN